MAEFDYIITAVFTANYDYTGYNSLLEVIDDFRDFIKREMWAESALIYTVTTTEKSVYATAQFSRLEFAVYELDFLQECMDEFSNFSFADLFADVQIAQVDRQGGQGLNVLDVHIQQKK